ncbi:IS5 family transposase [uncultured Chryseobacterium sp.]|uniref:IS5 family transposase n=1 Tax=uncultured Chryseobacterium sp. TaxID=259322 RepID=UPI0025CC6BA1|nr:IS5 family transposase [uncultured Chryseobacterium sp.]
MTKKYLRLTDRQWQVMEKFLPVKTKGHYALRDLIDAIFWILRTGSQWRNLAENFPKWESVYYHFRKWGKDGTLSRLNAMLNKMERKRQGKRQTPSLLSIDSQSIKSGPLTQLEKGVDGNKKINGRKRHVITDTLGLIWGVKVGPAHQSDGHVAKDVVEPLLGYLDRIKKILGDQAYKKGFTDWVKEHVIGLEVEISSAPPSEKGFVPLKWRWVTERTFGTFNFFRRLDKDHEKTPESQQYWILWQNCQIILNKIR